MKQKYLLFLSYIGTRYRGAVKQMGRERLTDLDTIEGAIETAFYTLRPYSLCFPQVFVSSRTDSGVHALCNSAQLILDHPNDEYYDAGFALRKLNVWFARGGHEIRLTSMYPVSDEFDYRRSAKSRTYFYRLMIAKKYGENKIPIAEFQRAWHIRGENIDIDAIRNGIKLFSGKKNYESFSPKNRTNKKINYVKTLMNFTIEPTAPLMPEDPLSDHFDFWKITIQSKSFVYNQVRRIITSLVYLASGWATEKDIKDILHCPCYSNWPDRFQLAPPQGLFLKCVEYDQEQLNRCIIKVEKDEQPVEKDRFFLIL